ILSTLVKILTLRTTCGNTLFSLVRASLLAVLVRAAAAFALVAVGVTFLTLRTTCGNAADAAEFGVGIGRTAVVLGRVDVQDPDPAHRADAVRPIRGAVGLLDARLLGEQAEGVGAPADVAHSALSAVHQLRELRVSDAHRPGGGVLLVDERPQREPHAQGGVRDVHHPHVIRDVRATRAD